MKNRDLNSPTIKLDLRKVDVNSKGYYLKRLNKEPLKQLVKYLAKALEGFKIEGIEGSDRKLVEKIRNLSSSSFFEKLYKEDLIELYLAFVTRPFNIHAVANRDPVLTKVWKFILYSTDMNRREISGLLQRNLFVAFNDSWSHDFYCEPLFYPLIAELKDYHYFSIYREREDQLNFHLSPSWRDAMCRYFYGEDIFTPGLLQNLPEDKNFIIENFESSIPSDLNFLSAYAMTEKSATNGKLKNSQLKNINKSFQTPHFNNEPWENGLDRIELLVNSYLYFYELSGLKNQPKEITEPGVFAKYIVEKLPAYLQGTVLSSFIPEFKGFTQTWAGHSNAKAMVKIVHNLISEASRGWMSLDNFRIRYLSTVPLHPESYTYLHLFNADYRSRHSLKPQNEEKAKRTDRSGKYDVNWFEDIDFPFIIHWLKFLCACGLLEIAYDFSEDSAVGNEFNPEGEHLENMRYIRLTPLGNYALGFSDEYTSSRETMRHDIEIDDKNCIITLLSPSSPYAIFLRKITTPISSTRFHISTQSILKGCISLNDAKSRIESLKSIIDLTDYPSIQRQVDEVEKHLNFAVFMPDVYSLMKVMKPTPELIKLLTSNAELRENVILAENGYFLVKRFFLLNFKSILARHSFFLE